MKRIQQPDKKIISNHKGHIAKLRVRLDLEELGYTVFESTGINQYGDFVAIADEKRILVKVKSAKRTASGYNHGYLSHHNYDVLALVVGNTIIYQENENGKNS